MTPYEVNIILPNLPSPLRWYQIGVHRMFPLYGPSGGLTTVFQAVILDDSRPPFPSGIDLGRHGLQPDTRNKWLGSHTYAPGWKVSGQWYVIEFDFAESVKDVHRKISEAILAMTTPRAVEAIS